jgi:cohesin loading factor subunit SCC2
MDYHSLPGVHVVINVHPDSPAYRNGPGAVSQPRSMRPLSVDEALQFSPMTTAPIFGLGSSLAHLPLTYRKRASTHTSLSIDSIIRPDVGGSSSAGSFAFNRSAGKRAIEDLNKEAELGPDKSARLKETRGYLQELLDGDQLTEL